MLISYTLGINVHELIEVKVGKLGKINFRKGNYIYVGSGKRAIKARVARHLKNAKVGASKKHWYIDYLLSAPNVNISKVNYSEEPECKIAKELAAKFQGIKQFGCSDCRCESHLFKIK